MQLPQFIQRMLGFAEKTEAHFTAASELAAAKARIVELEGELALSQKAAGVDENNWQVEIKNLNDQLAKTRSEATEREKNLQAQLEAAQAETTRVKGLIAAQGIPLDSLPAAETTANPAKANEVKGSLTEQCLAANKKKLKS